MRTIELQQALKNLGHDPGRIDGVMGRNTIAAIRAFQSARGLNVDGIAGPATIAALAGLSDATPVAPAAPTPDNPLANIALPWLIEAQRAIGITEDTSAASNPLIIGWAKTLRIDYRDDATSWCGLFVAHCIGFSLPGEPLPGNPLGARAWLGFGTPCPVPQPGAVIVFWREDRNGWKGHVGFYVGEDANAFHILGGNQGDAVNVKRFAKDRFLGARWPTTALAPAGRPRLLKPDGSLSTNEG